MIYGSAWTRRICDHLTGYTGRRIRARDLLVWSIDKNWIEKMQVPDEDLIFIEALEIWCLIRKQTKGRALCALS